MDRDGGRIEGAGSIGDGVIDGVGAINIGQQAIVDVSAAEARSGDAKILMKLGDAADLQGVGGYVIRQHIEHHGGAVCRDGVLVVHGNDVGIRRVFDVNQHWRGRFAGYPRIVPV